MSGDSRLVPNYKPLIVVCLLLVAGFWVIVPDGMISARWRVFVLAFMCGCSVGVAEIASRYRDEPVQAFLSPFGLIYVALNGAMSLAALLLVFKYPNVFSAVVTDGLAAALAAGFGAAAVMRSKIAVIKGTDEKDISIGPDFVIGILLRTVDKNVDRFRAERRQALVVENLKEIRNLGDFRTACDYLLVSLLAFQNLEDKLKQELGDVFDSYERKLLPVDLKYLATGFVFLTLVGETHFKAVLENASKVRTGASPMLPPKTPTGTASAPASSTSAAPANASKPPPAPPSDPDA